MTKKNIFILNKKEGKTPLEAMEKFRSKNIKYKDLKMTYAGRLDPMASGALLVLAGGEVKNKEKYLTLDKEYELDVLFGFATDTYDILGKVTHSNILTNIKMSYSKEELRKKIKKNLKYFRGKFIQKYPLYSSKTVKGKALFEYAREGVDVEVPEREVCVKEIKLLKLKTIKSKKLAENIKKRIEKVQGPARQPDSLQRVGRAGGDFRQKEIIKIWHKKLTTKKSGDFFVVSFRIKCTSGTYMRGIANSFGERVGIPALAFLIKRTKIGRWSL